MRVYVPTTPARLASLRDGGLPTGTEGYAVTAALADALGLPRPTVPTLRTDAEGGDEGGDESGDVLLQAVLDAAAEASLLLLAEDGSAPARRAVVVVETAARPVEDDDAHPATVALSGAVPWSAVDCVLADDETAAERVGRAAALVETDQDRAVERLERDQLGWFGRDEL